MQNRGGRSIEPLSLARLFLGGLGIVILGAAAAWALVCMALFWSSRPIPYNWGQFDLEIYRAAGRWLLEGRNPYDPSFGVPFFNRPVPFAYAPIGALLCVPLALLQPPVLNVVSVLGGWLLPGIAVVLIAYRGFLQRIPQPHRVMTSIGLLVLSLATAPSLDVLFQGQVGMLILCALLIDLAAPAAWRAKLPQGVLTGLVGAVKLTPLVVIPYLLVTGQFRAARNATITVLSAWVLPALILPRESATFFLNGGFLRGNSYLGPHVTTPNNQSIAALVMRVTHTYPLPLLTLVSIALPVVILGLFAARTVYLRGHELHGLAIVGLTSFLASPISWTHHGTWLLLVPAAILTARPASEAGLAWWQTLVWGAFVFLLLMPQPIYGWGPFYWLGISEVSDVLAALGIVLLVVLSRELRRPLSTSTNHYYRDVYEEVMYTGTVGLYSRFVHWLMERPFRGANTPTVLEVGAGAGQHARFARGRIDRYIESDVDIDLAPRVGEPPSTLTLERVSLDAEDLSAIEGDSVDRLIATCLLAHLERPEQALLEWRRVVRPGGHLTIYVPTEPGMLLRLVRNLVVVPKSRALGQDHLATVYRDHRNHYPGMRAMLETVFVIDTVRRIRMPVPFLGWNFSLFEIYQITLAD